MFQIGMKISKNIKQLDNLIFNFHKKQISHSILNAPYMFEKVSLLRGLLTAGQLTNKNENLLLK